MYRYFPLAVELTGPVEAPKAGAEFSLVATIRNRKDPAFYLRLEDAVAHDLTAELAAPDVLAIEEAVMTESTIGSGGNAKVEWRLRARKAGNYTVCVKASSSDTAPGEASIAVFVRTAWP